MTVHVPAMTEPPVGNLAEWVRRAARHAPERAALIDPAGARWTWQQLDQAVDAAAAAFAGRGLIAGYRVAWTLPNCPEFAVAYFGALRAGLVAVPLNPADPADRNARLADSVGARLLLDGPQQVAELVAEGRQGSTVMPPTEPELLATLLSTSGTSGEPRAVMLTHRALAANLEQLAAVDPPAMRGDDLVFGAVPFCHVFGLNVVLGMVARTAATVVTVAETDPARSLEVLAAYEVSNLPVAPAVLETWVDHSESERASAFARAVGSVRLLLSGAAPLSAETADRIRATTGLQVHEGYGLTEAAGGVTSTLCSPRAKSGSVGAPLPGVEVRIARQARDATDDPGEVQVRGANLFSGVWPDRADGPGSDGWYATGDLGYVDADGDLFLVDRDRELIGVAGFSVYPREVENVIVDLPGVAAAAVVGVPGSDPQAGDIGEIVKAYVVPVLTDATIDDLADRVREHCRSRLARFKCPSVVEVTSTLPRSVTGKIVKRVLR